jgi:ribonuclease HII
LARGKLGLVDWSAYSPEPIIGVDEVGRGCLAGPVVAAAVVLTTYRKRRRFFDSKQLSEIRREELFNVIKSEHRWAVGFASVEEIDRINIYHASLLAMRRAVTGLGMRGGHVLVDGKAKIPKLVGRSQTALISGDSRAEPISAASIVAKVTRDTFMKELAQRFPDYGFEVHKGYATAEHRRRLAQAGPSPFHRRSFNWGDVAEDGALSLSGTEGLPLVSDPGLDRDSL